MKTSLRAGWDGLLQGLRHGARVGLVLLPLCIIAGFLRAKHEATAGADERIVGLPCEGCDAVFVARPDEVPTTARLAPVGTPGERLRLDGTVRDADGKPVAGVIVYAYHTDATGHYPRSDALRGTAADRHGALRGFARTDARGAYAFDTIRPVAYPDGREPQHIHQHVIEPGRCTYYIGDVWFDDDPLLTAAHRDEARDARGGSGIVTPRRDADGSWRATRDIALGQGIDDYDACD